METTSLGRIPHELLNIDQPPNELPLATDQVYEVQPQSRGVWQFKAHRFRLISRVVINISRTWFATKNWLLLGVNRAKETTTPWTIRSLENFPHLKSKQFLNLHANVYRTYDEVLGANKAERHLFIALNSYLKVPRLMLYHKNCDFSSQHFE